MKTFKQFLIENQINTDIENKKSKSKFVDSSYNPLLSKTRQLGHGIYASTKDHPTDPHMVKKHTTYPIKKYDGYDTFVLYIIEHKLMDNPFFPKIYNIKNITDRHGQRIVSYTIEKLKNYNDNQITKEHILSIFENLFNIDENEVYKKIDYDKRESYKHYSLFFDKHYKNVSSYEKHNIITDYMDKELKKELVKFLANVVYEVYNNERTTPNKLLSSALKTINDIVKDNISNNMIYDLHSGNILFRLSPTGIQMVFNDPIA